jgi:3-deoxy-D-manno-octulosonic-acid transferase
MNVRPFDSVPIRAVIILYRVFNYLILGPLLFYLWWRSRKDKRYGQHIAERFGFYRQPPGCLSAPVWVHAVSLGELRSAVPLIKALLQQGEHIVTTHFTPVGRHEAEQIFADEIKQQQLQVVYIPLELQAAFFRFFRHFSPRYGLVMEVEFWPCMIDSARKAGVPLFLCNGQYPSKSYQRDTQGFGLRASLVSGFAGAMVKSDIQQKRFNTLGQNNVAITGELRFDQPIPDYQINASNQLRAQLPDDLTIVTIASAVEGEDELYIDCMRRVRDYVQHNAKAGVLFIYVPRAPERFPVVQQLLGDAGLITVPRSQALDKTLGIINVPTPADVLLGDSMGEMYFYLQLAKQVIVGGGFTDAGAHNISEAFAVSRPVFVGPTLWTIEYPATEAMNAGVLRVADNSQQLYDLLIDVIENRKVITAHAVDRFFADHRGAIDKTLAAIPALLEAHGNPTSR